MAMHGHHAGTLERTLLIGLIAFLTVVDLFGTQAILPALVRNYGSVALTWNGHNKPGRAGRSGG
jgi:hypothetical protein